MIIGIHLGANYTRVGIKKADKNDDPLHILRDIDIPREGNADRLASVVSFHEDRIKIGTDGFKNQEQEVIFDACRVGTDYKDVEKAIWHAKRSLDGTYLVKKGIAQIPQEDIVLEILKRIKKIFEEREYNSIKNLVISTPYNCGNPYEEMIKNAVINAKFNQENLVLIEETEAAAKSFYELSVPNQYPHNLLVFKFGAGSFSESLVQKQSKNDRLEILKTTGNPRLGGEDITNLLIQYCLEKFEQDLAEIRKKDLRESCERVKSDLSYFSDTKIIIEEEPLIDINRDVLEKICADIIVKIHERMHSITEEMKTRKIEIHDVLLVGGSTRLHFIREIIDSELILVQKSKYQYDTIVIAEEAIALGCAIHGLETSIEVENYREGNAGFPNDTGMVPPVSETPNDTGMVPPVSETPNDTGMVPTIPEVPNDMSVAPTITEVPNDTSVTPTVPEVPKNTYNNSKDKEDNHETDKKKKQQRENNNPRNDINPADQDNVTSIKTLLNNQPKVELRHTSPNNIVKPGIDLIPENRESTRTNEDISMNNKQDHHKVSFKNGEHIDKEKMATIRESSRSNPQRRDLEGTSKTKKNGTINTSNVKESAKNDLHNVNNKKSGIEANKTSEQEGTNTDIKSSTKLKATNDDLKQNKNVASDLQFSKANNTTNDRTNQQKDFKGSMSGHPKHNNQTHHDHRTEIPQSLPIHEKVRNNIANPKAHQYNLGGDGPSTPVAYQKNIESEKLIHKDHRTEVHHSMPSQQIHKQITENRQILKEQLKRKKSVDENLALKVQQSYIKNPNSPVQPPYMNNDEKTKPGDPKVIGNFVKFPANKAESTTNLVKSPPNPAASGTSYDPQNREPLKASSKDKEPFMDSPIKRKLYEETRVWYNEIQNCRHLLDEEKANYQTYYCKKFIQNLRDDYLEESKSYRKAFLSMAERRYQELKYKNDILEQFKKIREKLEYIPDEDLKTYCILMLKARRSAVDNNSIEINEKILENCLKEIQIKLCLLPAELKNPTKNLRPKVSEWLELEIRKTLIMPTLYYCKYVVTNAKYRV